MSPQTGAQTPLRQGLAVHSFAYLGGFAGAGTGRACPSPLDVFGFMDLAAENRMAGVEFPPDEFLKETSPDGVARVREYAEKRGLFIVFDTGPADSAELKRLIPIAARLNVHTIRVTASLILCGDRAPVRDTWAAHVDHIVRELREARGPAEEAGVTIAIENHQDLTSKELVEMCDRVGGRNIGATLDAVNPLAVVEEPLEFARRLGGLIKYVHLKDYQVYRSPEGFRLARCVVGDGVLDIRGLLTLLEDVSPDALVSLELGALEARHIRFLDSEYWLGFPPRRVEEVLPVLRMRDEVGRPDSEEWRTPWEKNAAHEELVRYEMEQFRASVENLRRLRD